MTTEVVPEVMLPPGRKAWTEEEGLDVPTTSDPIKERVGKVKTNVKGAPASGEAERIARIIIEESGEVNATAFALVAYGEDGFGSHQSASSSLGSLVKKGTLKRTKMGLFIINDEPAKPKRKYKKREPKTDTRPQVGDLLEVVGYWNDNVVLRSMDNPTQVVVMTDVT